jgi:hypothetical protein
MSFDFIWRKLGLRPVEIWKAAATGAEQARGPLVNMRTQVVRDQTFPDMTVGWCTPSDVRRAAWFRAPRPQSVGTRGALAALAAAVLALTVFWLRGRRLRADLAKAFKAFRQRWAK